jgi:transcriptional repressor NF-X1
MSKSLAPDLATRIHEDIDNGQYECVICTSEVVRTSQIWTCSICWTVSHLHCVKKWYKNQSQNVEQQQQELDQHQPRSWRCPGCNSAMNEDPGPNTCWCGKEMNPKSIGGLPPHSCGQTCWKPRAKCPHPCPKLCHAGPCDPCDLMGPTETCFCGKQTSTKRCVETDYGNSWSCGEICADFLPCGEHECDRPCHPGLCGSCSVLVTSTCYCGRQTKEMPCEERGDFEESFRLRWDTNASPESEGEAESTFDGCFQCDKICGRTFDCGKHNCPRLCHAQDEQPAHCPFAPDVVSHCPCGKTVISDLMASPRTSCLDDIPRCTKRCDKVLSCGHSCADACHSGDCRPCLEPVKIPCRCGRTTTSAICHTSAEIHPQCERVCRAQMECGRHECRNICCAGEKRATERQAAKRKKNANTAPVEYFEAEHVCLRVCGRQLKCGKHTCQQLCHKGVCNSCPEAIFEEISCACGRTVLQPPQPCGTQVPACRYDCTRPQACGHPVVAHNCHPDSMPCPKCPFLVDKPCACGKQVIKNKACGVEEVHCGLPCGKALKCG